MSFSKKIKTWFRKHKKLYFIVKVLTSKGTLEKSIKENYPFEDGSTFIVVPKKNNENDKIYYRITNGVDAIDKRGMCALIRHSLEHLFFVDELHLIPIIYWGKHTWYYDENKTEEFGENIFEYYFKPEYDIPYDATDKEYRIIEAKSHDRGFILRKSIGYVSYNVDEKGMKCLGENYKRHFILNDKTAEYVYGGINELFKGTKKVLGVHVRGTDFKQQLKLHPHFKGFGEFLDETKKQFATGKYDKVFIATDDAEALELFRNEFKDKLLYYTDCARADGNLGVHVIKEKSPYVLGLEILRDIYTLTACSALICGLSHVAFAAQYVKLSKDEEYDFVSEIKMQLNK